MNYTRTVMAVQYVVDTFMMKNNVPELILKLLSVDLNMLMSYEKIAERFLMQVTTQNMMK